MPSKPPGELEKMRAVRYMRHVENCYKCRPDAGHYCMVALGHYGRWVKSYYKEALGMCKHFSEGECWEEYCRGGKSQS